MYQKNTIYLKNTKSTLTYSIYYNKKKNVKYDPFIILDGQNALFDEEATFHHSLKLINKVKEIEKRYHKNIILICLYSPNDELARFNMYSPLKVSEEMFPQATQIDTSFFKNFEKDLMSDLVSYFRKNYPLSQEKFVIYGSSLGANMALYLGYKYPNKFKAIGAFSSAHFIHSSLFYDFLDVNFHKNIPLFLYCGKKEKEGDCFYYHYSDELYNYLKNKKIKNIRYVLDLNGIHNEINWRKHFLDFFSFVYNHDEIIY